MKTIIRKVGKRAPMSIGQHPGILKKSSVKTIKSGSATRRLLKTTKMMASRRRRKPLTNSHRSSRSSRSL
jgi:hypothetical protein